MSRRLLLFDIGNTRVKWGVLVDGELRRTGSVAHATLAEGGIESLTRRLPRKVDGALACNVAGPEFATRFARAIGIHYGGDLRFVHSERAVPAGSSIKLVSKWVKSTTCTKSVTFLAVYYLRLSTPWRNGQYQRIPCNLQSLRLTKDHSTISL